MVVIERIGNLATIDGPCILVHGVNGGWVHGPKFGAGFAASLAERGPMARESYFALEMGRAAYRRRFATMIPAGAVPSDERADGLPLGWIFPRRIEDGVWLVHGVTQRSVRGTKEKTREGKTFVRNKPAVPSAIAAVLDASVAFMRRLAKRDGVAMPLHMPRIGCGHGGLDWDDVRALVERVEQRANVPLPGASDEYRAACEAWPATFNVWSL